MIKLIGLHGFARSGKDTVARHLRRKYGFHSMAFAEGVRETTAAIYDVEPSILYDDDAKDLPLPGYGISVRQALINVGMGCRAAIGESVWLDRWHRAYHALPDYLPVVVRDVRLDNEAELIRQLGGLIVHIHRDGAGVATNVDAKGSESGIAAAESDVRIDNNRSIEDLHLQIDNLLAFLNRNKDNLHTTYQFTTLP